MNEKDKVTVTLEVQEKRGFIFTLAGDPMYCGFRIKKRRYGIEFYLGYFVFKAIFRSEEWNNRTITIATLMEAGENDNIEIVVRKPEGLNENQSTKENSNDSAGN